MAKRLRNYMTILAPNIEGYQDTDLGPVIYDYVTMRNLNPNNIDDKILIYERQVKGWFLDSGEKLKELDNMGFVILMIALSYIEGVQQYFDGQSSNRESRAYFIKSFKRIFQLTDDEHKINDLYNEARCGLFHDGMSRGQVLIHKDYEKIIDFSEFNTIKINQNKFLDSMIQDFSTYITLLRDENNHELRQNFDNMFNISYC